MLNDEKVVQIISKDIKLYLKSDEVWLNDNKVDLKDMIGMASEEIIKLKTIAIYQKFLSRHFENTLVLTGAGSSYGFGTGDIHGLSMKDLWRKVLDEIGNEELSMLAETIHEDTNLEEKNLEDFLSKAKLYMLLYENCSKVGQEYSAVKETIEKIKNTIIRHCSLNLSEEAPHKEFLKRLTARKVKYNRLKVFTTNYDLLFEQAANEYGFMIIDGFSYTYPRTFNGNNFDCDLVVRKNSRISGRENYAQKVFHLYKLHGSLDWSYDKILKKVIKRNPSDETKEPIMIYPSRLKYEASYEQPFFEMMSRFQAELRLENVLLLVIGYSFGDNHLNSMINEALELNHSIQLVLIDPFIENFKDLIEKTKYKSNIMLIRSTFEDFALNYPYASTYGLDDSEDLDERNEENDKSI